MQLRIPGPTPLPDEVLEAMNRNMISHRGAEFHALMRDLTERLKLCFQTEADVLVFPGAGTGGLEASLVNLFSPGDTVVSVTSGAFGAVDMAVDKWEIDVAITASQKAWMAPPGLTMLSVSRRAWEASRRAQLPRFYWDFAEAKRYLDKDETPYTPAVSLLFGLQASLHLIMEEGLSNVFARHER